MNTRESSEIGPPLLVSEREAARLLGVTPRTVFRLRLAVELPAIRIGARVLYSTHHGSVFVAAKRHAAGAAR
ncbi:MAG: helix-turn-helix domain-containing protein [Tepidisphaeraceae bacterium]